MKKRLTALLLALTLALGALPAAALEEAPPAVPAEAAAHSLERDDPQPGPDERPDEEARPAPDEDGGAAPETAGGPPLLVRRERGQGRGHPGLCAGQRPDAGAAGRHRPGGASLRLL